MHAENTRRIPRVLSFASFSSGVLSGKCIQDSSRPIIRRPASAHAAGTRSREHWRPDACPSRPSRRVGASRGLRPAACSGPGLGCFSRTRISLSARRASGGLVSQWAWHGIQPTPIVIHQVLPAALLNRSGPGNGTPGHTTGVARGAVPVRTSHRRPPRSAPWPATPRRIPEYRTSVGIRWDTGPGIRWDTGPAAGTRGSRPSRDRAAAPGHGAPPSTHNPLAIPSDSSPGYRARFSVGYRAGAAARRPAAARKGCPASAAAGRARRAGEGCGADRGSRPDLRAAGRHARRRAPSPEEGPGRCGAIRMRSRLAGRDPSGVVRAHAAHTAGGTPVRAPSHADRAGTRGS